MPQESSRQGIVRWQGHELVYRAYFEERPGMPLVLVHGLVASIDFFSDENIRQLGKMRPVYSLSLPAHAPSVSLAPFTTNGQLLADCLAAQIEDFSKGRPVAIVGHSTGATAGLATALYYPDRVARLVVCEGASHGRESEGIFRCLQVLVLKYGWLGSLAFKAIFKFNAFRPWSNRLFLKDLFADPKSMDRYPYMWQTQKKYFPTLKAQNLDQMKDMFADLDRLDLSARLKEIRCPTLVMIGTEDSFVPMAEAERIAKLIPKGSIHRIEGGGHLPFFETPEIFERTIGEFLDD